MQSERDNQQAPDAMPAYSSFTMILPTFNEQDRIRRIVSYYRNFARLIVVDNYSTDDTARIVADLGIPLVHFRNPGSTQTRECMEYFFSLSATDYVLVLACSEFIPTSLLAEFDEIARARAYDVVSCVRDSYTCGERIPLWGGRFKGTEARIERFFNKYGVDLDNIEIHGHFTPVQKDRIGYLSGNERHVITHLRDADADSLMRKTLEYARVEVQHRERAGRTLTAIKLVALFFKETVRFLHVGPSHWNMIALREIWARLVMHTVIYWLGWEQRTGMTIGHSRKQNERLWQRLVSSQKGKGI